MRVVSTSLSVQMPDRPKKKQDKKNPHAYEKCVYGVAWRVGSAGGREGGYPGGGGDGAEGKRGVMECLTAGSTR